jgi:flagellar hook-length control protein FliK
MNNALLNGLSGEPLKNSFPVFQNPGQNEKTNEFSALLEKNLFSGLDSNEIAFKTNKNLESKQTSQQCCFEQNSFSLSMRKKMTDNRKIRSESSNYHKQGESLKKDKQNIEKQKETEGIDKKQEAKTNKSENSENFDEKLEAVKKELIRLTGSEKDAEELMANLSDQELVALNQIIEKLDQKSLETLQNNPELLTDIIKEEISNLPDSAKKQELLATLDSQEIEKLTAKLAEIASSSKQQSKKKQQVMTENTSQVQNAAQNNSDNRETQEKVKEPGNASESKSDAGKPVNSKDAKHTRTLNNENQNSQMSEPKNSEESLRHEFAKVNKTESDQSQTTGQQTKTSNSSEPAFKVQAQETAPETTGVQTAVKKFVETLMNNKTANSAKEGSFTYSPQAKQGKGSSGFQNNSGSGFSNGFSSNSGANNNSIAGSKPAASPQNSVFLSQLIEKAEMLKTNDGKKVLSMKLDPKELGKMEMELTSRDGNLTARISAESELAKVKLEQLSQQIKEHLNEQGINLTEITVDISSQNPDERNRQQLSQSKNKSSRIDKVSKSEGEQIIKKNVLPNLRSVALNIQSVDLTV